jgi:hypothetical protein
MNFQAYVIKTYLYKSKCGLAHSAVVVVFLS